jgi:hypothetical protein
MPLGKTVLMVMLEIVNLVLLITMLFLIGQNIGIFWSPFSP